MRISYYLLFFILISLSGYSCTEDEPTGPDSSDFDRQAMLKNWADHIIIPAFASFAVYTDELNAVGESFSSDPTLQGLEDLREAWEEAYLAFQHVSMFEMGNAMDFRNYLNIYPTCISEININRSSEEKCIPEIQDNIEQGSYNLALPEQIDAQGFPALDYLLYGLAESDDDLLEYYTTHEHAGAYRTYITDLTARIDFLTGSVSSYWQNEYRDDFVQNTGNGANASVDMMVNDYILYYEKALRAGKVGIPAGVFSGTPLSTHVEAYYRKDFSKELLLEALGAAQDFFNGKHFNSDETGESLNSYLDFLNTIKEGPDLSSLINNQFETARNEIQALDDNLAEQVESNNSQMLSAYDKLQLNVVYMKVDMLQALDINVDYIDADGD
ncbi:MAG: imelysin family protein [Balneolales bacterium]